MGGERAADTRRLDRRDPHPHPDPALQPASESWGFNAERRVLRDRTTLRWSGISLDSLFYDVRRAGRLRGVPQRRDGISSASGDAGGEVYQLRFGHSYTPDLSLATFMQFDSESRALGLNARLRWTLSPGADLFVVWSRDGDARRGGRRPPGGEGHGQAFSRK